MLQNISTSQDPYFHASSLLIVAEIDLSMGVLKDNVLKNIELVRSIFATLGIKPWIAVMPHLRMGIWRKRIFPQLRDFLMNVSNQPQNTMKSNLSVLKD
jgi:hypothetical protein